MVKKTKFNYILGADEMGRYLRKKLKTPDFYIKKSLPITIRNL